MAVLDRIAMPGTPADALASGFGMGDKMLQHMMQRRLNERKMSQDDELMGIRRDEIQERLKRAQLSQQIAGQKLEADKLKQNLELQKFMRSDPEQKYNMLMDFAKTKQKSALQPEQSFIPSIGEGEQEPPTKIDWSNPEVLFKAQSLGFRPDQIFKQQSGRASAMGSPSSNVANQLRLQQAIEQYGADSPEVQQIQEAIELDKRQKEANIYHKQKMGDTAEQRATSGTGKEFGEALGLFGSLADPQLPADKREKLEKAYQTHLSNKFTTVNARNKLLAAANVEKTIDNLDPDALTQYSGPQGLQEHSKHKLRDMLPFAEAPEKYKKYNDALTAAEALATQVRQFYGDSVTPTAMRRIESLTNPSSFSKSPEIAKRQLKQLFNILRQETQTYVDSASKGTILVPKLDFKDDGFVQSGSAKKPGMNSGVDNDPLGIR